MFLVDETGTMVAVASTVAEVRAVLAQRLEQVLSFKAGIYRLTDTVCERDWIVISAE